MGAAYLSSSHRKKAHLTQLNTKIVLTSTLVLVLVGTIVLAILEWDGAFKGMSVADKITHSFINAVSPRTAGFNTIELLINSALLAFNVDRWRIAIYCWGY